MSEMKSEVVGDWFVDLVRRVAKQPGALLGSENVRSFETYLAGYLAARRDLGMSGDEPPVLHEFEEWLSRRGSAGEASEKWWCWMVEAQDSSATNVKTFFVLFEQFLVDRAGGN